MNGDGAAKIDLNVPRAEAAHGLEPELTVLRRASWGALGALLPMALRLAGEGRIYEKASALKLPETVDALFTAIISILAGATVAAVFQDERSRRNLLILGISAPALINSWAAYGTANRVERDLENLKYLQNQSAGVGEAVPTQGASSPQTLLFDVGRRVYAADQTLPTFTHAEPSTAQEIKGVFTGSIPNRDYFVVLGSFSSLNTAQRVKEIAMGRFGSLVIELYGPPPQYAPPLYSVVASPNLAFSEAQALVAKVATSGYPSAYIWTFGTPLKPMPECSMARINEHVVTELPVGTKAIYVYILKQRLWHSDKYADVYFFLKRPWIDGKIRPDQFSQRIGALAAADYLEINAHNGESIALPLNEVAASFSLEMHQVESYADVRVCLN